MVINKTELPHMGQFVAKVLENIEDKERYCIDKNVIITNCNALGVYFECGNVKFFIKTDGDEIENGWQINWILFIMKNNEYGMSYGDEISRGTSIVYEQD